MQRSRIVLDPAFTVGEVDRRLFGSFVEHMGRCVYTGIHEPGHPTADGHGFRGDVAELTREAGVSLVRYPGGNFVSGYRWEDGVGPVEDRPTRIDLAWRSVESNAVGLNEFVGWARRTGVEPMMAVNLGTRGVQEACDLLEYANHPGGTALSDLRARHGHAAAARHPAVVPGQRAGRALADRAQDGRRVRPPRRRDGQGDAPGRPGHRARGLRQLQQLDADVRVVGGDRARPRLRRRRPHQPARLLRGDRRRPRELPRLVGRHGPLHPLGHRDRRPRGRQAPQPQADHPVVRRVERLVPARVRRAHQPRAPADAAPHRGHLLRRGRRGGRWLPQRLPAPRRPRQDRLPGAARQRHRPGAHARRAARLAADDLPPVRADRPARPGHLPARGALGRLARDRPARTGRHRRRQRHVGPGHRRRRGVPRQPPPHAERARSPSTSGASGGCRSPSASASTTRTRAAPTPQRNRRPCSLGRSPASTSKGGASSCG